MLKVLLELFLVLITELAVEIGIFLKRAKVVDDRERGISYKQKRDLVFYRLDW